LPEQLVAAQEGPALLYRQGLESGIYRPDPLQQVTVQKLQVGAKPYTKVIPSSSSRTHNIRLAFVTCQ
jgi:hypothetical protein